MTRACGSGTPSTALSPILSSAPLPAWFRSKPIRSATLSANQSKAVKRRKWEPNPSRDRQPADLEAARAASEDLAPGRSLLICPVASFSATASASAAGTFTSGLIPVPSQSFLVIGLTKRANGMRMKK